MFNPSRFACLLPMLFVATAANAYCTSDGTPPPLTPEQSAQVAQEVAETPNGVGRLYEISGNGASGLLFGTFHSAQPSIDVPATVATRLARADQLLVEVRSEDQAQVQTLMMLQPHIFMDLTGKPLQDRLNAEDWNQLTQAVGPLGMPPQAASRLRPWFAATLLALPACEMRLQATGAPTLDMRLEAMAEAADVAVSPLESVEDVFGLMNELDPDTQLAFLEVSLDTVESAEAIFTETLTFYTRGEIARIAAYADALGEGDPARMEVAAELIEGQLLEGRNRNWMPAITSSLQTGDTVIAVGALHLVGETGLVELLRADGYIVERIVLEGEVSE